MLTITIINDNTGVEPLANYTYLVRSNYKVIASGRIEGHNPADGWKTLALEVVAPGMLGACKRVRDFLYNLPAQDAFFLSLSPQLREFFKEAIEGIQAAIAKVEVDE